MALLIDSIKTFCLEQGLLESLGGRDIRHRRACFHRNRNARPGQRHIRTGENFPLLLQRVDAGAAED